MINVISSNGWLTPALQCMELAQMVTQGMWTQDHKLLQVPHVSMKLAAKCSQAGIHSVYDLTEMEDADRTALLGMSPAQLGNVARFCNTYPDLDMTVSVVEPDSLDTSNNVVVKVTIERDEEEEIGVSKVVAARFPGVKYEGYWCILGDVKTNKLLSIKRFTIKKNTTVISLDFLPKTAGTVQVRCYVMSDSYIGVDLEEDLTLTVAQGAEQSSSSDDSDSDSDVDMQ
jgi:pre-mRNA-splicing helicase BRR2